MTGPSHQLSLPFGGRAPSPTANGLSGAWATGPLARPGPLAYVHLIRSPDDPPELSREARQRLVGAQAAAIKWRSDFSPSTRSEWRCRILEHLADGRARTFNATVVELTAGFFTADRAFAKAPDLALWDLVAAGAIEHTLVTPVLFRKRTGV